MEAVSNTNYKKGFLPYAIAAALVSLVGGFTVVLGPAFVADIGIEYKNTTWISLAMAIGAGACAPVLGKLADLFGRRNTLLIGILIYTLGNVLTAISSNLMFMLVARFVVGVGAAAIAPVVMAYIATEYPPAEMAKGFGLYMLIASGAVVIGPTLGGIIMKMAGWRVMMYVCVGISVLVYFLCTATLKKVPFEKRGLVGFDYAGAVLVLVFFSAFLCLPSFGQNIGWSSVQFYGCAAVFGVALIALFAVEKKAKSPILNGKFMARKAFVLTVLALFLTQGLMQANMTNTIIFVRMTQPENVLVSSYAISIMYIGMSLGSILVGPMADKKEPRYVLTFSLLLTAVGVGIMYLFTATASFAIFAAALGILGIGLGGNATIFMKVVLSGLSREMSGSGTGTYGVFRDISAPFGVAVFVPMFTVGVTNRVTEAMMGGADQASATIQASVSTIQSVTLIELACIAAGIVVVLMLPKIHAKKDA